MGMMLMTKEVKKNLKPLDHFEKSAPEDVPVAVKFFNPTGAGTWYITEWDGEDVMFGLCVIHEAELGYVSLSELAAFRGPFGLGVERDRFFGGTLADAMKREHYNRN
jgi:hypothetical protein